MKDEEKAEKWWIVPTNSPFFNSNLFDIFGYNYKVEPQEDFYSKSFPPLKSDFNSKEEAEKWLKEYLETKENETCEEIIIGEQQEINDLKKENEELKKQLEKENAELKEQIKKMKCCGNCKFYYKLDWEPDENIDSDEIECYSCLSFSEWSLKTE